MPRFPVRLSACVTTRRGALGALCGSLATLQAFAPAPAVAAPSDAGGAPSPSPAKFPAARLRNAEPLPTGVVLNGEPCPETVLVIADAGPLFIREADLARLGISPQATGPVRMAQGERYREIATDRTTPSHDEKVHGRIDTTGTLQLDAPASAFAAHTLGEADQPVRVDRPVTAAFVDYDLGLQRNPGTWRGSALIEGGVSGAWGVLSASVVSGGYSGGTARLDTAFVRDFPARRTRLVIGDTLTRGSTWSAPARIGGIRLGTDFSLDPQRITWPLPEISGSTVVPTALELVARQDRREVSLPPGAYTYAWRPQFSGAGDVTMTLRDASGAVRSVSRSFYAAQDLLRPGLVDYSLEAGFLRRRYGLASFDYGPFTASAGARRGMTRHITLEARIEAGGGTEMVGAATTLLAGTFAQINLAGAVSSSGAGTGTLLQVQAQRLTQRYSLTASYRLHDSRFRQVGDLPDTFSASRELAASGSLALGRAGSITAGYLRVHEGSSRYALASAGWSGNVRGAFISVGGQRIFRGGDDTRQSETSLFATLTMQLGRRHHLAIDVDRTRQITSIERTPTGDIGLGYRLAAGRDASQQDDRSVLDARLQWRTGAGEIDLSAQRLGPALLARADIRGGVVMAAGTLRATRQVQQGIAIVDVASTVPAQVLLENRRYGVSAGGGHTALITGLPAYTPSRIAIDPDLQPIEDSLDSAEKTVTPGWRQAVRVHFGPTRDGAEAPQPVRLRIVDTNGAPLPAGRTVTIDAPGLQGGANSAPTVTGHDGEVFLSAYRPGGRLTISGLAVTHDRPAGVCRVTLAKVAPRGTLAQPQRMTCFPDNSTGPEP